jgi:hypothetical protein
MMEHIDRHMYNIYTCIIYIGYIHVDRKDTASKLPATAKQQNCSEETASEEGNFDT